MSEEINKRFENTSGKIKKGNTNAIINTGSWHDIPAREVDFALTCGQTKIGQGISTQKFTSKRHIAYVPVDFFNLSLENFKVKYNLGQIYFLQTRV